MNAAKKAIGKMPVRTVRSGDTVGGMEISSQSVIFVKISSSNAYASITARMSRLSTVPGAWTRDCGPGILLGLW